MPDINEVSEYFIGLQEQLGLQLQQETGNETVLRFFDEYPHFLETYTRTFLGINQFADVVDVDTAVTNTLTDTVRKLQTYSQPQQIDQAIIRKLNIANEIKNPMWLNLLESSVRLAPFLNNCEDDLSVEVLVSMVMLSKKEQEASAVGSNRGTVKGAIDFLQRYPDSLDMMHEMAGRALTRAEFLDRVLNPKRTAVLKAMTLTHEPNNIRLSDQLEDVVTSLMDTEVTIDGLDTTPVFDALTIDEVESSDALIELKYHTIDKIIDLTSEAVRNPSRSFTFDAPTLGRVSDLIVQYPDIIGSIRQIVGASENNISTKSIIDVLHNEKLLELIELEEGSLNLGNGIIKDAINHLLGLDETIEARPIYLTDRLLDSLTKAEGDPAESTPANILHAVHREFRMKPSSPINLVNAVLRGKLGIEPTIDQLRAVLTHQNSITLLKHLLFAPSSLKFDEGIQIHIAQMINDELDEIPDPMQDVIFYEEGLKNKTQLNDNQRVVLRKYAGNAITTLIKARHDDTLTKNLLVLENTSRDVNARAKFLGVYPEFIPYLVTKSKTKMTPEDALAMINDPEWSTLVRIALFQCRESRGFKSPISTQKELFELMAYLMLERGTMSKTSEHLDKVMFSLNNSILINPNEQNADEEMHLILMTDAKIKKLKVLKTEAR